MSKFEPQVGQEFPLDEGESGRHHRRHHHHMHHRHGHHHRHRHGFGALAFLLVAAGIAALIIEHRLTPDIALGLIAAGAGLLLLRLALHAVWHWRHRNPRQVA